MQDYMMLKAKIDLGKDKDINQTQLNEVDGFNEIIINNNLPRVERVMSFLRKVKNPYMFSCNGMLVKFEFSNTDTNINQCLENVILNKSI